MTFFGPVGPWCGPGPTCRGIADQLGHPVIVVQQRQVDEQQGGAGGGGVAPALLRAHPSVPILAKIVQPAQHMEEAHAQPQQGPTAPVQDLWTQLHPVGQPELAYEDCPRSAGARRGTSRWGLPRQFLDCPDIFYFVLTVFGVTGKLLDFLKSFYIVRQLDMASETGKSLENNDFFKGFGCFSAS